MYTPEVLLQRNLLVLECLYPESFKYKVYYYLDSYSTFATSSLVDTMNALSQILIDKGLDMSLTTLEQLLESKKIEEVSLIAQLNALATLIALKSVPFEKPLSWWINTSLQLVDVTLPVSNTLH